MVFLHINNFVILLTDYYLTNQIDTPLEELNKAVVSNLSETRDQFHGS